MRRDVRADLEHHLITIVQDEVTRIPQPPFTRDVHAYATGEAQQAVSGERLAPDGEHVAQAHAGTSEVDHAAGLQRPGVCVPERIGDEAVARRAPARDADPAGHDDHAAVGEELEVDALAFGDVAAQAPEGRRAGQWPARRRLVRGAGADRNRGEGRRARRGEASRGRKRTEHRLQRYLPLAFLLLLLVAAPAARADGDPASDILVNEDVYYGYGIDLESKEAAQLPAMLATSRERGYELKVALISGFVDLGIATWMWLDPREYARYLGDELSLVYKGRLLVLMRNGYGVYYNGEVPGKERRVISRLDPPRRAARFLDTAIDTVRTLAAANDVKLTVPDVEPPPGGIIMGQAHATPGPGVTATATPTAAAAASGPSSGRSNGAWLFLAPVGLFVLAALAAMTRSRRRA
jgi:hypothetical protein